MRQFDEQIADVEIARLRQERASAANEMLDRVRASLREYPHGGGDIAVMREVDRIISEATDRLRKALEELAKDGCHYCQQELRVKKAGGITATGARIEEHERMIKDRTTEEKPQRAAATPNRLKFASLVQKLDPMDPDYAAQVALLDRNYRAREDMQVKLKAKIWVAEAPGLTEDQRASLNNALRVAIDRWVVDHF